MSGNRIIADTNVIIHLSKGSDSALKALDGKEICLSIITCIELLSKPDAPKAYDDWMREVIDNTTTLDISQSVYIRAISIRKHRRLKLADAIIAATATVYGLPLLTFDAQFKSVSEITTMLLVQ